MQNACAFHNFIIVSHTKLLDSSSTTTSSCGARKKSLEQKLRDRNYRRIRGRGKSQDQYGCDDGAHPDHPLAIYRLFYHTLTLYLLMTLIVSREEEQQQKSIAAIPMSV